MLVFEAKTCVCSSIGSVHNVTHLPFRNSGHNELLRRKTTTPLVLVQQKYIHCGKSSALATRDSLPQLNLKLALMRFFSMTPGPAQLASVPHASCLIPAQTRLDIRTRLGQRVRFLRRERKWTQQGMARHFGLDRAFLSDIERGRKSVSLRTLEVIALGMKLSISDLLQDL